MIKVYLRNLLRDEKKCRVVTGTGKRSARQRLLAACTAAALGLTGVGRCPAGEDTATSRFDPGAVRQALARRWEKVKQLPGSLRRDGVEKASYSVVGNDPGKTKIVAAEDAIFRVDFLHNVVHLATGLLLLLLPFILGGKQTLLLVGVVYAAVAVLGFLHPEDSFLIAGQIAMNQADRFLHVALAAVILLAGLVFSNHNQDA